MMRKARLAFGKVNAALNGPKYYFGTGGSLLRSCHTFSLAEEYPINQNA